MSSGCRIGAVLASDWLTSLPSCLWLVVAVLSLKPAGMFYDDSNCKEKIHIPFSQLIFSSQHRQNLNIFIAKKHCYCFSSPSQSNMRIKTQFVTWDAALGIIRESETIPRIMRVTNHSPGESVNTEWWATYIHHDLTWRCVTCVMWHSSPVTCSSRSHEAMIMTIERCCQGKSEAKLWATMLN